MHPTIPILRIFSAEKAEEFYIGWLGFKIDWEHRFEKNTPQSIQVSRGNLVLHLSEHHRPPHVPHRKCAGKVVLLSQKKR